MASFYLDEDLSPVIAQICRSRGFDVTSCHEIGNLRMTDPEQLTYSTAQGRCLVTANGRDFERLAAERFAAGELHMGVAIVPGNWRRSDFNRIALAIERLAELHASGTTECLQVNLR